MSIKSPNSKLRFIGKFLATLLCASIAISAYHFNIPLITQSISSLEYSNILHEFTDFVGNHRIIELLVGITAIIHFIEIERRKHEGKDYFDNYSRVFEKSLLVSIISISFLIFSSTFIFDETHYVYRSLGGIILNMI